MDDVERIAADHIADAGKLVARIEVLEAALASAIGHLMNAKIDLETGCPKRTAIATIEGGIRMARVAQHLKQENAK